MTDLVTLQKRLAEFRDARGWQGYHTPSALARAVAVEAGELNALFLWDREPMRERVAQELADVLIYGLNLCNTMGFDAGQIISDKITMNEMRPVKQGRRFLGIELKPEYAETAVKNLRRAEELVLAQGSLFPA